jgi:hypothetical protein
LAEHVRLGSDLGNVPAEPGNAEYGLFLTVCAQAP